MRYAIIASCLGLVSCTPIEREIVEYELGATAPPKESDHKDVTRAFIKNDDTSRVERRKKTKF